MFCRLRAARRNAVAAVETAFTTAAQTAVVLYLLDFLAIGWRPAREIVWISPFHDCPALSVMAGEAPFERDLTILSAAAAVCAAGAYWRFARRDL